MQHQVTLRGWHFVLNSLFEFPFLDGEMSSYYFSIENGVLYGTLWRAASEIEKKMQKKINATTPSSGQIYNYT